MKNLFVILITFGSSFAHAGDKVVLLCNQLNGTENSGIQSVLQVTQNSEGKYFYDAYVCEYGYHVHACINDYLYSSSGELTGSGTAFSNADINITGQLCGGLRLFYDSKSQTSIDFYDCEVYR